jgi:hypothetical protein
LSIIRGPGGPCPTGFARSGLFASPYPDIS